MPIKIGSTGIGSLYLGSTKISEAYLGSTKVYGSEAGNYTLRLKFSDGVTPTFTKGEATQISSSPNIWDWVYSGTSWGNEFMAVATRPALLEVISGNTQGVTSMAYWFYNCSSLTSISFLNTSSVTNMSSMFRDCSSLTTIPLLDTSSVTNMSNMFENCSSLTTIPLLNTSSVTNMNNMFYNCSSLTSIPLLNTSSVTSMGNMFENCSSLATLPLLNTSSVTYMHAMFKNCSSLPGIPLFDASSATTMTDMLAGCTHIAQSAYDFYNEAYFEAARKTATFSHAGAFTDCGSLSGTSRLSSIYATWGGTMNGNSVSTTVKTSKQLWTISDTVSAPWGLDVPLYLHGPNPFSTNSPSISKLSISWTGSPPNSVPFAVAPAVIQFSSGSSGSLSFIRRSAQSSIVAYPANDHLPSMIKLEIPPSPYPIIVGSYDSSKPVYFAYVAYVRLDNYGLQSCADFNTTPTLYWTF